MVCENYMARISALIDDELSAEERLEVLEHMAQCPACKAYWEELLMLRDALRAPLPSAPAGFAESVMARVRETGQEKPAAPQKKTVRFPQWRRFAGLAACCAVVLLGIFALDLPGELTGGNAARDNCAPQMYDSSVAERYGTGEASDNGKIDSDADAGDAAYEMPASDDAVYNAGSTCGLTDLVRSLSTDSEIAGQWVEAHLGEVWASGDFYALTEEQYYELRKLLTEAGEAFTEITGNENGSSYQLLAE